MRESFIKDKKLIFLLTAFEIIVSLVMWFKISFTDPKILDDITTPILMFIVQEFFLIFLFLLKAAYNVGFKAGITGFYLGLVFLFLFHLVIMAESSGENIAFLYIMYPLYGSFLFFPLWMFIHIIIKISK